ncbi:2-hydroxychromene-2-carboxylate isomerase [Pseudooceanicola marinus]|uniref:2-hydroxychromene-2-carboxylate isomerase n=1 Tax=Pseudooceanicola marinus TaxID=396013 RepID=A0A1X6Y9D2_9RHOB|nr:2-hydroxychromene-2-carboxylate isomerase [Pseudooceanicola marinus]PJE33143.1 2-hydroxychromene-2-carboxylate isomerase [Pseudooceanicola marinus]SLN14425.1 2-hydroxychromene-2-carboxylate isomerase [Pseudooceanicola marinus]
MSRTIDYYFTTISPWAYLAGDGLERIAAEHEAQIRYKPVDLMAVFARSGGQPLGERPPARQAYRMQELRRAKAKTGMDLVLEPAFFPTNPAPSCYAIIAADRAGGGDTGLLVRLLMRACWAEEKNIAEDDVIRAALEAAGFDPGLADSGLLTGAETFLRYTEEAVTEGVFGSPFYIVDGTERFWGQDRLADLDAYLAGRLG